MKYRLGLDLGTNSIGWAIVELNDELDPVSIKNAGSRIFSDGRDAKVKTSLAVARREARSARRRRDRFLQRKKNLFNFFIRTGFFPNEKSLLESYKSLNPYELRYKCISDRAEKFEIARAIYHISQRRGFKSSRKESSESKNKFTSGIESLKKALIESGVKTLGEYFYKKYQEGKRIRTTVSGDNAANLSYDFVPTRKLYEEEVEAILDFQKSFHPEITDEFKKAVYDIIFYQRPLKPVEVGRCQVYPDKPRAHRALPSYQRYCIEQDIANLRVISYRGESTPLTEEQKKLIRTELESKKERTKEYFIKALKLDPSVTLNLQKDKYKGAYSEQRLKRDFFGIKWDAFSLQEKDKIVETIINDDENGHEIEKIADQYQFSSEKKAEFIQIDESYFGVSGYCALSSEALIEALAEGFKSGRNPSEIITELKSLNNPSATMMDGALLPYYGKIIPESVVARKYSDQQLSQVSTNVDELECGKIGNPTVHIVLGQVRRVVNRIIEKYGKPTQIHIEIVRDLKMSREQKQKYQKSISENEKANKRFKEDLEKMGLDATRDNLLKLKLWNELSSDVADRKCPYSGRQISMEILFSPEIEIEHILPYSRTLDDSLVNKTVAFRSENKIKGNRSPFEAFGENKTKYDAILNNTSGMPFKKRKRFFTNAMEQYLDENQFLSRQLNDTAYISRTVRRYLSSLLSDANVQVSPGKQTAFLRYRWGLDSILNDSGENKKNRGDHRHHAVDAIVIAMSDKKILKKLADLNSRGGDLGKIEVTDPFSNFRENVKTVISNVLTSHKPDKGYQGRFFKDSNYGIQILGEDGKYRKIKNVADVDSAQIGTEKYRAVSRGDGEGKKRYVFKIICHPKDGRFYKAVMTDGNLKIEIWEDKKKSKKIIALPISIFDAYRIKADGMKHYNELKKEYGIHPAAKKIVEIFKGDCLRFTAGSDVIQGIVTILGEKQIVIEDINVDGKTIIKPAYNSIMKGFRKLKLNELGQIQNNGQVQK